MVLEAKDLKTSFDYVCIFTGGSIRGGAYIGALRAMEQLNANIKCLVGSSVGSVIASFYAAGYTPLELESIVNGFNFDLFKDINISFNKDFSISKGELFLNWIRENIEKKVYGENYVKGKNQPVTFKDLKQDIVIITTDLQSTKVQIFSRKETPDFEVAQAVKISSSMPGLLKPTQYEGHLLVDGDLSRSWPIWKIVPSLFEYNARMLEFRLEGSKHHYNMENTADFLNSVYTTFSNFAADHVISTYQSKDKFDYIRLDAGNVNITDFNLSTEKKEELYALGYRITMDYFKTELPQKRAKILPCYKKFLSELTEIRKYIDASKYVIAKNKLSELFVHISKARKLIDTMYYDKILEFYEEFVDNLFLALGIVSIIKNKKSLMNQLDELINLIENKVQEIEAFLAAIDTDLVNH